MLREKGSADVRTNRFLGLTLRVMPEDHPKMVDFYCANVGFKRLSSDSSDEQVLALPLVDKEVSFPFPVLRFVDAREGNVKTAETDKNKSEAYSKTGFFMHDADAAGSFLQTAPPFQLFEIAYLTHGDDPLGLNYELLQTTQESNQKGRQQLWNPQESAKYREEIRQMVSQGQLDNSVETSLLATQPLVFGLITIRVPESEKTLNFYQKVMGMKVLSVMPIPQKGFTLYFLAYTQEDPPNTEDLTAYENREWTWQRKLTTLELLCRDGMKLTYNGLADWQEDADRRVEGLDSFQFLVDDPENLEQLRGYPGFVASAPEEFEEALGNQMSGCSQGVKKLGHLRDPNNMLLEIYTSSA